jgi:choline kinase
MKSHGPTSLIKINNKTLLEKQVDIIKSVFTNYEIILCSGFETQKIVNFVKSNLSDINIRVVENQMHYNSNCCESARLSISNTLNSKLIIIDGNILIRRDNLKLLNMTTSCVMIQNKPYESNLEIGVIHNGGRLENMSPGIKNWYWSEILYLNGHKDISNFYNVVCNPDFKNKFLFEAINEFNKKNKLLTVKNDSISLKIDNIKTLKRILK